MSIKVDSFTISSKKDDKDTPSMFTTSSEEVVQPSSDDYKKQGIEEAEAGHYGKALSLLSHAITLNDKDYKLYEMVAQIHLIEGRPFGGVKYSLKSLDIKPDWCEGYVTLARSQRELGEVKMSIDSYKKAIALFKTAESLDDDDKEDIKKECKELELLLANYTSKHGELQGRAHVVDDITKLGPEYADCCSMKETWKEEIKNSEIELKERKEEEKHSGEHIDMDLEK